MVERYSANPSFTLGVWFPVGSAKEARGEEGLTHFIEHMLFRGTKRRSSFELSREIDKRGGILNGFTSREFTCFYVKLMKDFIDIGLDVLVDMVLNSLFDRGEIEKERKVILHEIDSSFDSPEERVFDLFYEGYWKGSSLSHPILGRRDVIESVGREELINFFERKFTGADAVISISGDVDHESFMELVRGLWNDGRRGEKEVPPYAVSPGYYAESRDIEQIHVVMGFKAFSAKDKRRYPLHVLSTYLGSGMSSVLFQRVREELAACYSISTFYQSYANVGLFGVYFATSSEMLEKAIGEVAEVLSDVRRSGIPESRLGEVKGQTKGLFVLSSESSEARMGRMAKNEFYHGRGISIEETLRAIDEVSAESVLDVSREVIDPDSLGVSFLGPLKGLNLEGMYGCLRSGLEG